MRNCARGVCVVMVCLILQVATSAATVQTEQEKVSGNELMLISYLGDGGILNLSIVKLFVGLKEGAYSVEFYTKAHDIAFSISRLSELALYRKDPESVSLAIYLIDGFAVDSSRVRKAATEKDREVLFGRQSVRLNQAIENLRKHIDLVSPEEEQFASKLAKVRVTTAWDLAVIQSLTDPVADSEGYDPSLMDAEEEFKSLHIF